MNRRVISILGARPFFTFGLVTFLIGALLSAVNITSRHALKDYVEDQLNRIPWDLTIYDLSSGPSAAADIKKSLANVAGIERVEDLVFLRAMLTQDTNLQVDYKPMSTPWLCLLSATDKSLLPPEMQLALQNNRSSKAGAAVMGLIGPEQVMGHAFYSLQGARNFSVHVWVNQHDRTVFTTPVNGVIRMERDELNRWLMDQTGSVDFVPYIGTVLLMPYRPDVLNRFDSVAEGLVPQDMLPPGEVGHVQQAEYYPEVMYLARMNRNALISGWDISVSLAHVSRLRDQVQAALLSAGSHGVVDSTTAVLLERMDGIAKLIGLLTLLIALPLLWMAWVLAANLSGLLMLNERRKLGLMRLRGVPGKMIGRSFLLSISGGGLLGGVLGLIAGSVLSLLLYEHGHLPAQVLLERQQIILLAAFLVVTLALTLMVSWRLVRYATTISPLEASGRVAISEAKKAEVGFGFVEGICLILGGYTLAGWIWGFSLSRITAIDQILDFAGLPLFLYGVSCLLVSRRTWIHALLAPVVRPMGGRLGSFALNHASIKPHRTIGFLLIVALMVSVGLYPTITSRSFQNKAERGAKVEMGSEWQFIFNSPDLVTPGSGPPERILGKQIAAMQPGINNTMTALRRVRGVEWVGYLVEAVLPDFYLPGHGFTGVPMYLIGDPAGYLRNIYSEPELGMRDKFADIVGQLSSGDIAVSPPVADFWRVSRGSRVLIGSDDQRQSIDAAASGVVAFLPGMPPRSVTDRQGYVQARVDYLNYLFSSNAYLVGSATDSHLGNLQALVPRVIILVKTDPSVPLKVLKSSLAIAMPTRVLEAHNLNEEIGKLGSDMFIALAVENLKIYLFGGLLLALIAIVAVALANYAEDRRTLALLRIRGASPNHIFRFLMAMLLAPAILGLLLGAAVALAAGYGLTNYVWKLRELRTVVELLPTRLVVSHLTVELALLLLGLLIAVACLFSLWVFRRTARENMQEG